MSSSGDVTLSDLESQPNFVRFNPESIQSGYGRIMSDRISSVGGYNYTGSGFYPISQSCSSNRCARSTVWKNVTAGGVSGVVCCVCYDCANFDESKKRFIRRDEMKEEILRLGASKELPEDVPRGILADWYEDHGLSLIADYLRGIEDGEPPPTTSY